MKGKSILISGIIVICFIIIYALNTIYKTNYNSANSYFKVYLQGEEIGLIDSSTSLYQLINKEQEALRIKYNVDNVYPPSDFEIVKTNTYHSSLSTVESIYKKIEEADNFTIQGYIITLNNLEDDNKIVINVLDRSVFEDALKNFVFAFVDSVTYNNYINDSQEKIVDVGSIIDKMYFKESISIKEGLISVNSKIYTDVTELSQYLLFGEKENMMEYTVKLGDTLESIAEENKLNVQELLVSNPLYRSEAAILAVGDKLNVTYLNPMLNLVEEIHKVEDVEAEMETKVIYDDDKPTSYSEVTTEGVTGITRLTQEYQVINGEPNSEVIITHKSVIREAVPQVTTKGRKYASQNVTGTYVDTGLEWGWPTNTPYVITSGFMWRWGKHHDGIDISGTGEGSPIYAAGDGVVVKTGWNAGGQGAGESIVIQHGDNYYTMYAHMISGSSKVSVGQNVVKGQIIGAMGHTGYAFGTHLHFALSRGPLYQADSQFLNPLSLYR